MSENEIKHTQLPNASSGAFKGCLFVTGIGTDVGKTVASAIIAEALKADYWKPVQSGFADGTDCETVKQLICNPHTRLFAEIYKLRLPASPHIAARQQQTDIELEKICRAFKNIAPQNLVIEGAGGLMVPLNEREFVIDLIKMLNVKVILVSRNYLGSINHSLLTAQLCRQRGINVAGWIFNGPHAGYEDEIARWSGYPKIASIPLANDVNREFVKQQALLVKDSLLKYV